MSATFLTPAPRLGVTEIQLHCGCLVLDSLSIWGDLAEVAK
jgi:hypothetical protein